MTETLTFRLVDAFAEQPYRGNPAGVVLSADRLNDSQMQRIAREVNASETAFLSGLEALHSPARIRWFTPQAEVGFCGHATLAAAHALVDCGAVGPADAPPEIVLNSRAGELRLRAERPTATAEQFVWWLQMPAAGLVPDNTNPMRTCELLGITLEDLDESIPAMRTRDGDVIYLVKQLSTLMDMAPRFGELAEWGRRVDMRGICVATTNTVSPAVVVQSRFFAPAVGINEDPVTGSVHGPLAELLVTCALVGSAPRKSAST